MTTYRKPVEQETVRMTIVGGRPPGSGKPLGPIPRGIEVLIKKAAVDPEFKALLLEKRAEAAQAIGLVLDPAEAMMLAAAPAAQLESVIAQTTVAPALRPAFLGRAAAVMLVALGAAVVTDCGDSRGIQPDRPPAVSPTEGVVSPPAETTPPPTPPSLGVRPDQPPATAAGVTISRPPPKPDTPAPDSRDQIQEAERIKAQLEANLQKIRADEDKRAADLFAQREKDRAAAEKMAKEQASAGIRPDRPPATAVSAADINRAEAQAEAELLARKEKERAAAEKRWRESSDEEKAGGAAALEEKVEALRKDWQERFPYLDTYFAPPASACRG